MALLGSSLQGQLSGFQFSVHPDQDKNQGTPLSPWRTKGVPGTVRRRLSGGTRGSTLGYPRDHPGGQQFSVFQFFGAP
jgi:hypothetical protein